MNQTLCEGLRRRFTGSAPIAGLAVLCLIAIPGSLWAQPVNDLCTDAITLDCGLGPLSDLGTNSGASGTSTPFCGMNPGTHAVWYSVMGNGGDIQVDTCSTNTNFDTRINVYTGDCAAQAAMGCVGNNDDAAGSPPECELGSSGVVKLSRVSWTSVADVEYFIVVSGFGGAEGDFELLMDCEVPVELQLFTIE